MRSSTLTGLALTTLLASCNLARADEVTTKSAATWQGVASLRALRKNESTRTIEVYYPVFAGSRRVARVAGLVLKQDALKSFNGFIKDSQGSARDLGLSGGMKYNYSLNASMLLNRPRLISVATLGYEYTGGAHGVYGSQGYVFGYPQGSVKPRQLHLADFFADGAAASKRINTLLLAKLRATKDGDQEATFVVKGQVKSLNKDQLEDFAAVEGGLEWYFAPYEVGPYSSGEITVTLTARELGSQFRAALIK